MGNLAGGVMFFTIGFGMYQSALLSRDLGTAIVGWMVALVFLIPGLAMIIKSGKELP